ncbi:MAG: type II toxin-antitoxin system HicA family toxin [Gaiellaceae bacterium]
MAWPRSTPRRTLIRKFRKLGFDGPHSGGKHSFMRKGALKVRVPNEHGADIGASLLGEILKHADVSEQDWGNA